MNKRKIAIVFGGRSSEHDVSLMSAASVIRAINKERYELVYIGITREGEWRRLVLPEGKDALFAAASLEDGSWLGLSETFNMSYIKKVADFALPIVHGPYCEDGQLQGFFETVGIPYGGCGVLASALAMDKLAAKDVFDKVGFPICKHRALFKFKYDEDREKAERSVESELGSPCCVKPANMGSSVGITKAHNKAEFFRACDLAFRYDKRLIIEEAIDAREIEAAVLGNAHPEAAVLGEIIPHGEFYTYESKYEDEASVLKIPADISPEMTEEIKKIAVEAFQAIDGEGYARVDFFVEKNTNRILLNEINTLPGFTKISMFPMLWEAAGLSYPDTIERIIELGYERYYDQNNRQAML